MDKYDKCLIEKVEKKEKEYEELAELLESVEIVTDNKLFQFYQRKHKRLTSLVDTFKMYKRKQIEFDINAELKNIEDDEKIKNDLTLENEKLELEISELFEKIKQEYHKLKTGGVENITVELNYKSGNNEYINTIFDIFSKYKENNNFDLTIQRQDESSVIFDIQGENVYRDLNFLSGNIKVIFEGKESIFYLAILKTKNSEFILDEDDVEIEALKSGGAGGQHINKTESAIRLTHIPTGMSVICQDERSQLMNKKRAFENLELKLKEKFEKESKNDIILQRKTIKNALFSTTPALTINYDKNNILCNKTQKYYDLKQILNGNLQIIWSDVIINGANY